MINNFTCFYRAPLWSNDRIRFEQFPLYWKCLKLYQAESVHISLNRCSTLIRPLSIHCSSEFCQLILAVLSGKFHQYFSHEFLCMSTTKLNTYRIEFYSINYFVDKLRTSFITHTHTEFKIHIQRHSSFIMLINQNMGMKSLLRKQHKSDYLCVISFSNQFSI